MLQHRGFQLLLGIAAALLLARIGMPYIQVSGGLAQVLQVTATALFVVLPILGFYSAGAAPWTVRNSIGIFLIGLAVHIGGYLLATTVFKSEQGSRTLMTALASTGLMFWSAGLGAGLASYIKDKNLLLPVAAFLAGFDMFLVFSPYGPTNIVIERAPKVFEAVAYAVPTVGGIEPLARIGPADFMFLSMFFVALFRFNMRTRETIQWIAPVLVAYLAVVIGFGARSIGPLPLGMLPALVPIGLTILIVNAKEFRLNTEEKIGTLVVCMIAIGLAILGVILAANKKQASQSEISMTVGVPGSGESANSPSKASQGPRQ